MAKVFDDWYCGTQDETTIAWSKGPRNTKYTYIPLIDTFNEYEGPYYKIYKGTVYIDTIPEDSIIYIGYSGGSRSLSSNCLTQQQPMYVGTVIDLAHCIRTHSYRSLEFHAYPFMMIHTTDSIAYDPLLTLGDGDSAHVEIVPALTWYDDTVTGYVYPYQFSRGSLGLDSMYMDAATGYMQWPAPHYTTVYDYAFRVSQFKHGLYVGSVTRDMLIWVVVDTMTLEQPDVRWHTIDSTVGTLEGYIPDSTYTSIAGISAWSRLEVLPIPHIRHLHHRYERLRSIGARQIYIYDQLGQVVYQTTTIEGAPTDRY